MASDQLADGEVPQGNEKVITPGLTGKLLNPPHNPAPKNIKARVMSPGFIPPPKPLR